MKYSLYLYKSKIASILNANERRFFHWLKKYLDWRNLNICPKVRLKDIINVDLTLWKSQIRYINNKTFPKHLDFVISDDFWNIKFIIELDWENHKLDPETIKSDKIKNDICKQLGVTIIRFPNSPVYNYDIIDI